MASISPSQECVLATSSKDHDRFLPVVQTGLLKHDQRSLAPQVSSDSSTSPESRSSYLFEVSLRDDVLFVRSNERNVEVRWEQRNGQRSRAYDLSTASSISSNNSISKKLTKSKYQKKIAQALGLSLTGKVFSFNNKSNEGNRKRQLGKPKSLEPLKDLTSNLAHPKKATNKTQQVQEEEVKNLTAMTFVHAPGLRNDFYSNLISWSYVSNKIAVGLDMVTYLWNLKNYEVSSIMTDKFETISCVSCSLSDFLAIGTIKGRIIVVSQQKNYEVKAEYVSDAKNIHAVTWFKDGRRLLASNHSGSVLLLEVVRENDDWHLLKLKHTFKCHQQLVCGIALNLDETQAAFGSNDNTVSVWEIKDITNPKLKFILPHTAAIKAIAFCPWSKSLLMTGGGTKDRTIRFWHSTSGTLINSHFTNSQVTSLTWSNSSKELVATFGFGETRILLTVYTYPDMIPLSQVTSSAELRILSATISPSGNCLCVATNDSTIRIYEIWKRRKHFGNTLLQKTGTFGSSLIELLEGVDDKLTPIR